MDSEAMGPFVYVVQAVTKAPEGQGAHTYTCIWTNVALTQVQIQAHTITTVTNTNTTEQYIFPEANEEAHN